MFNCDVLLAFRNFVLWRTKWNFSVCYHTISPPGNIGKYFAIVKQKVIFPISQILSSSKSQVLLHFIKNGVLRQRKYEKALPKFVCVWHFKKRLFTSLKYGNNGEELKQCIKTGFLETENRNRIKPKLVYRWHYWKYCFLFLHDCGKWQRLRHFNKKCLFSQFNTFEICIQRVKIISFINIKSIKILSSKSYIKTKLAQI